MPLQKKEILQRRSSRSSNPSRRRRHMRAYVAFLSVIPYNCTASADRVEEPRFRSGSVVLRGRITAAVPYDEHSTITSIGGRVHVPSALLPDFDVSVFLSDRLSVSGQIGLLKTKIGLRDTMYGNVNVGTVYVVPASLATQYHIDWGNRLRPYAGVGIIANWYFKEKASGANARGFHVGTMYAPMVKGGLDYRLSHRWFVNAEARQIFLPTQTIKNNGVTAKTSLKTITAGIGAGYRF